MTSWAHSLDLIIVIDVMSGSVQVASDYGNNLVDSRQIISHNSGLLAHYLVHCPCGDDRENQELSPVLRRFFKKEVSQVV